MKKISAIFFLFCISIIFTAGKCKSACVGCKNIEVTNDKGLYVFHVPSARNSVVKPFITKLLAYNRDVFSETGAELVINAGYFDPKNHGTSSYVVMDKKVVLDPTTNMSLMNNEALKPFLPIILNRTEFRIMNCAGKTKYDITAHETTAPYKCEIVHSIQAGPLLYPSLRLEEEYFTIQKDGKVERDSITALKKCARTAIGIKGDDLYIIIATVQHRLTLPELSEVCKNLCLDKAMNFDGGGSTSLNFKGTDNPDFKDFEITSDKDKNARKLKSFLVVY